MQRGGSDSASWSDASCATAKATGCAVSCAARRSVGTSPTTTQPAMSPGVSRKALAMISGPIPAASPMVISNGFGMV